MTEIQETTRSTAKRWAMRGTAVSALSAMLMAVFAGQASAAVVELGPIADALDATIQDLSTRLVAALAVLLG